MKSTLSLVVRILALAVCVVISWRSVRLAMADMASAPATAVSFARAAEIEPGYPEFSAKAALMRADSGDNSPDVDRALLHALELNPRNAEVLIALGNRREFEGKTEEAAKYMRQAAEVDHAFRASWNWASFSYRNGHPEEVWRMAKRCLELEPLGYDPEPVFDLLWRVSDDAQKIQELIPATGPRAVQYLNYLAATNKLDAAMAAWPKALNSVDPSSPLDPAVMQGFVTTLAQAGRMNDSVSVWNQLVDRKLIDSGPLKPQEAVSIADPRFAFPAAKGIFSWAVTGAAGAFAGVVPGAMRVEFDGNEPEALAVFSTATPLIGGGKYRLAWKYDSSRLALPRDTGFVFAIVHPNGDAIAQCEAAFRTPDAGECAFTAPAGKKDELTAARVELRYARALGTVRAKGELRFTDIHLEFGS